MNKHCSAPLVLRTNPIHKMYYNLINKRGSAPTAHRLVLSTCVAKWRYS